MLLPHLTSSLEHSGQHPAKGRDDVLMDVDISKVYEVYECMYEVLSKYELLHSQSISRLSLCLWHLLMQNEEKHCKTSETEHQHCASLSL